MFNGVVSAPSHDITVSRLGARFFLPRCAHTKCYPQWGWRIVFNHKVVYNGDKCGMVGNQKKTAMFIGEYRHTIDDKGRLAIPAKFRSSLKKAVVTRGLDTCLFLYPIAQWKELAEKLSALPISQSNSRAFARLMLAGAMEVEVDRQGRIVLPEYLREYARLAKNIVVAGLYNRVELWSEDAWKKYTVRAEKDSGDIAEQMLGLGV